MNISDVKDLLNNPFVQSSIIAIWHILLIVIATIGATQIAKAVTRFTTGKKFDGLIIQATALIMALIFSRFAWDDPTGWLVGGFVAYALSSVLARFGLIYLRLKFPKVAKFVNQSNGENTP